LHNFRGTEGPQKSDDCLPTTHEREIGLAGNIIRAVAQHLQHNVSGAEYGGAVGHNLRALFDIHRVGIAGLLAGARFHDDFESRLYEVGNGYGNERNPALSGIAFFGNSDDHAASQKRTENSNRLGMELEGGGSSSTHKLSVFRETVRTNNERNYPADHEDLVQESEEIDTRDQNYPLRCP
jgi:hypothetical protein